MKSFKTYQHLPGTPMTDRDKTEINSRFWNKGKWLNFVEPFLPPKCMGMGLIDVGCNSGLFLALAQEKGFKDVWGVDSDKEAIKRGKKWRDANKGTYRMVLGSMEGYIDELPVTDYTLLVNTHYYFHIDDWLSYLDKLQYKTRYCIIVTADKRKGNRCWAQSDIKSLRRYFNDWIEEGFIGDVSEKDDPRPRKLWGLKFKSRFIERVSMDSLDCGNHVQDEFYAELDNGVDYKETKYYKIIRKYRLKDRKDWAEERLEQFFLDRIALYKNVRKRGLKEPLLVDSENRILDGNHRYSMMKHLGFKEVFVRKV